MHFSEFDHSKAPVYNSFRTAFQAICAISSFYQHMPGCQEFFGKDITGTFRSFSTVSHAPDIAGGRPKFKESTNFIVVLSGNSTRLDF